MRLVATGTTPQVEQMWNWAVSVPKEYCDTRAGCLTSILSEPAGQEVQTPPCLTQNEQVQARAGISDGSGRQSSVNEMFRQWQLPEISMDLLPMTLRRLRANRRAMLAGKRPSSNNSLHPISLEPLTVFRWCEPHAIAKC